MSVRKNVAQIVAIATVTTLFLSGCSIGESEKDGGGMTKEETFALSFEEQYLLAGERYASAHELLAEVQRPVFTDEWETGGPSVEMIPLSGFSLNTALRTDDRENSYYFSVSRSHPSGGRNDELIRAAAALWESKGWDTRIEGQVSIRAVADTPDGYWVEAMGTADEFMLTVFSPVYWGERRAFSRTITAFRDAEQAAGLPGTSFELDPVTHRLSFLPGSYLPFPTWDPAVGKITE